jgi:hypothetical protein
MIVQSLHDRWLQYNQTDMYASPVCVFIPTSGICYAEYLSAVLFIGALIGCG